MKPDLEELQYVARRMLLVLCAAGIILALAVWFPNTVVTLIILIFIAFIVLTILMAICPLKDTNNDT